LVGIVILCKYNYGTNVQDCEERGIEELGIIRLEGEYLERLLGDRHVTPQLGLKNVCERRELNGEGRYWISSVVSGRNIMMAI
jgi:hypothetical protein